MGFAYGIGEEANPQICILATGNSVLDSGEVAPVISTSAYNMRITRYYAALPENPPVDWSKYAEFEWIDAPLNSR